MGETANLGLIMQAVGAVGQTAGAVTQSMATRDAMEAQAAVARANAEYEQKRAQDAITRGVNEEAAQRLKTGRFKSSQRAKLGASGTDLNYLTGSGADILESTDVLGEIDALTIRENASREAAGYIRMRNNSYNEAGLLAARADSESPWQAGFNTMLTTGSQLADSWYRKKAA